MVVSEQVPSPPNKPAVKHSFHLDRLSVVEAPENLARKRKKLLLLSGDVCRLLLSMISLRLWTVDKKTTNSGFLLDLTLRIILHCYIFLITSVVLGFSVDFFYSLSCCLCYMFSVNDWERFTSILKTPTFIKTTRLKLFLWAKNFNLILHIDSENAERTQIVLLQWSTLAIDCI